MYSSLSLSLYKCLQLRLASALSKLSRAFASRRPLRKTSPQVLACSISIQAHTHIHTHLHSGENRAQGARQQEAAAKDFAPGPRNFHGPEFHQNVYVYVYVYVCIYIYIYIYINNKNNDDNDTNNKIRQKIELEHLRTGE